MQYVQLSFNDIYTSMGIAINGSVSIVGVNPLK